MSDFQSCDHSQRLSKTTNYSRGEKGKFGFGNLWMVIIPRMDLVKRDFWESNCSALNIRSLEASINTINPIMFMSQHLYAVNQRLIQLIWSYVTTEWLTRTIWAASRSDRQVCNDSVKTTGFGHRQTWPNSDLTVTLVIWGKCLFTGRNLDSVYTDLSNWVCWETVYFFVNVSFKFRSFCSNFWDYSDVPSIQQNNRL